MRIITALLLSLAASQSFAAEDHFLENTSVKTLQNENNEMTVFVSYPGRGISGICDIEIVADSFGRQAPIRNLLNALEIKSAFGSNQDSPVKVISSMTLRIPLRTGGYTDGAVIRTKDGKSLRENIERTLGSNRTVVLMPRSC